MFPGAAFAFGTADWVETGCVGRLGYGCSWPEVKLETAYDLASLTKIFATSMVTKCLVDDQLLGLEDSVSTYLPEFVHPEVTVEHLLRHESGLPAYMEPANRPVLSQVLSLPLETEPGTTTTYSCLGFILLRHVCESAGQALFAQLFEDRARRPMGLVGVRFRGVTETAANVAPTSTPEPWRNLEEPFLQGIVHDPLAFRQGGVSGNAGLFGGVTALAKACQAILGDRSWDPWTRRCEGHGRGLGWDLKSSSKSSCGRDWSADSFGHTGYTGTSVWFEPDRRVFALLLTNGVHPKPGVDLTAIRARFGDTALRAALDRR